MNVLLGHESFLSVKGYAVKFCNISSFSHHPIAMEQGNAAGVEMMTSGWVKPQALYWSWDPATTPLFLVRRTKQVKLFTLKWGTSARMRRGKWNNTTVFCSFFFFSVLLLKRNDGNWMMTSSTEVNQYLVDVIVKNSLFCKMWLKQFILLSASYSQSTGNVPKFWLFSTFASILHY